MNQTGKILVFRFSAFGDVAMTIPVLASFLAAHPQAEVIFVSRSFAAALLAPFPQVQFVAFDARGRHKGLLGLWRLFRTLRKMGPFSSVIDLHQVLRTRILSFFFRLSGRPVFTLDKGRAEKKELVRKNNKLLRPLPSMFERYREVFAQAGFDFSLEPFDGRLHYFKEPLPLPHAAFALEGKRIGVAPFAGHHWKTWPFEKVELLVQELAARGYQVFLFGGRGREQEQLETLASGKERVHNLAGSLSLQQELLAMSLLHVMVAMDSANMHLARLVAAPVVSIWGATHPWAGFYGYDLPGDWAVQSDLDCRPCSVFGNKVCHRGDFACMQQVSSTTVLQKIEKVMGRTATVAR